LAANLTQASLIDGLMLTIIAKDPLRRASDLAQEIPHRVANSLQIFASLLMQSARKATSEDSRRQLRAVHARVMSMAGVQPMAREAGDEIHLEPFLTALAAALSLAIRGAGLGSILVRVDDSRVATDTAMRLGLMVTELLIDALEHAVPPGAPGEVTVDYRSRGRGWTLRVAHNGVGPPRAGRDGGVELRSHIVESLANGLEAQVCRQAVHPGAMVLITSVGA
jgi:two-component sensor histidine kinase